jgi:hypothetical protein
MGNLGSTDQVNQVAKLLNMSASDVVSATGSDPNGVTGFLANKLNDQYKTQFGTGMPSDLFHSIAGGSIDTASKLQPLIGTDTNTLLSQAASDPNLLRQYQNYGLITPEQVSTYQTTQTKADADKTAASDKAAAQVLPSELTTIEDWANAQQGVAAPTLDQNLINTQLTALQPNVDYAKKTMNEHAANAFATLFPQGGGSTYEAGKLSNALQGIDAATLAQATEYAKEDQNQKYATWQANQDTAKSDLGNIANFKEAAKNFATTTDNSNYWNKIATDMSNSQYYNTQTYNTNMWNKNAQLAQQLASQYGNSNSNPWNNFLNAFSTGAAGALGKATVTAL